MKKLKSLIYNLIRDDDENNLASNIFDGVIITLIIINVITIIADTFNLPPVVSEVFHCVEVVSVIIFSIEYVLRVWTSDLIRPDINPWKARLISIHAPRVGSDLMYNIESEAQPEAFSNAFDALWWAVATLTTVGYGDIYPVTVLGKLLSAVIALLGIGLVAIPTGIISSGFMECIDKTGAKDDETEAFEYCPHCGKRLKK